MLAASASRVLGGYVRAKLNYEYGLHFPKRGSFSGLESEYEPRFKAAYCTENEYELKKVYQFPPVDNRLFFRI